MNKKIILITTIVIVAVAAFVAAGFLVREEGVDVQNIKKEELKLDSVKAYFVNSKLDPEVTCQKVFPVERKIIASKDLYYEAAVVELLNGPTDEDRTQGYETAINNGVKIQKIEFAEGVVTVDFDKQMEFEMGGSCRVGLIRLQIEETLKQFPEVKQVIISIDGRTEDVLQP